MITKKQLRINKRKDRLENIARQHLAYCNKHNQSLTRKYILEHHCYNGTRGRGYCKYLEIFKE